jgi:hypothetical protein
MHRKLRQSYIDRPQPHGTSNRPDRTPTRPIITDLELLKRYSLDLRQPPDEEGRRGVGSVPLVRVGLDDHPTVHSGSVRFLVNSLVVRVQLLFRAESAILSSAPGLTLR